MSLLRQGSRWTVQLALLCFGVDAAAAVKIQAPEFRAGQDGGEVSIKADGAFTAVRDEQASANQIVFQIDGAELAPGAGREIPTGSFPGKLRMIQAYAVPDKPGTVRVALQMTDKVEVQIEQQERLFKIKVPANGAAVSKADETPATTPAVDAVPAAPVAAAEAVASSATAEAPSGAEGSKTPQSESAQEIDGFLKNRDIQKFTGKPITLQVQDGDVRDVMRMIGEASGFNIVLSDGVTGKITLSLVDVPWDQVLDLVLRTKRFGAERNFNVLRVMTLNDLREEKNQELSAKQAVLAATPKIYRVFRTSYTTPGAVQPMLTSLISSISGRSGAGGGEGGAAGGSAASITTDARTNSLIIYDTAENIQLAEKFLALLDRPVPQVMVEARVVEARESFTKALGGQLGVVGDEAGIAFNADPGNVSALLGSGGSGVGTSNGVGIVAQPSLSFIPGFGRLSVLLTLGEQEGEVKTVSNPRTVTMDGQNASVNLGLPVNMLVISPATGGGTSGSAPVSSQANLNLSVTPRVLADGSIQLNSLSVNANDPDASGTNQTTKTISTNVIVESGTTLMIGGIYKNSETFAANGIPLLRNIPLLGWLFGSENILKSRIEFLVFVTPRVVSEKEATPVAGVSTP